MACEIRGMRRDRAIILVNVTPVRGISFLIYFLPISSPEGNLGPPGDIGASLCYPGFGPPNPNWAEFSYINLVKFEIFLFFKILGMTYNLERREYYSYYLALLMEVTK